MRSFVAELGAEPITLSAEDHDRLVAMVSHVPHLTAVTLMRLAGQRSTEHRALLRLAAGGFRDMTRIASGHPGIWPDICEENKDAITSVLDDLMAELGEIRRMVADGDRKLLYENLEEARQARMNLPVMGDLPTEIAEVRIPVPDRPGSVAEVTSEMARLGMNILDLEIAHSGEGGAGVLVMVMDANEADLLVDVLAGMGMRGAVDRLS